jgi:hypothetical protein
MVAVKSGQPIPRRSVALNPSPRSNAASILDRHGSLGSVIWLRLSVRVAIPANDLDEIASPHCLPQGSGLHHDSKELRPAVEFALQNPFAPTTMSQMGPLSDISAQGLFCTKPLPPIDDRCPNGLAESQSHFPHRIAKRSKHPDERSRRAPAGVESLLVTAGTEQVLVWQCGRRHSVAPVGNTSAGNRAGRIAFISQQ